MTEKPADGKLPLPPRYRDDPTTGEVLYEYIRASEKLRAAATLHIFDAWLQTTKRTTAATAESLRTVSPDGRRNVSTAGASAEAEKEAAKAAEMAAELRREMRDYFGGVALPMPFLKAIPCPLTGGGFVGVEMLTTLAVDGEAGRFDRLSPVVQGLWDMAFLHTGHRNAKRVADNPHATADELRKALVELTTPTKGGRPTWKHGDLQPAEALNALWCYQVLKIAAAVGLQKLRHVFALPDELNGTGLPYTTGVNGKDYPNRPEMEKRAKTAEEILATLDAQCPDLPPLALMEAALIGANFAKMKDWDKRPDNAAKLQAFMISRNITVNDFEAFRKRLRNAGKGVRLPKP